MDPHQIYANYMYKQFYGQGFIVVSIEFVKGYIHFNLSFPSSLESIPFRVSYNREANIWSCRKRTKMDGIQLYKFLRMIHIRYAFYMTMRIHFQNQKFTQFIIGNFDIDDEEPLIRFYFKELYWILVQTNGKFSLYEFYKTEQIPHLKSVSFDRVERFIKAVETPLNGSF